MKFNQTYLSFSEILTRSEQLQDFVKKTETLLQINRYVQNKLDPILAAHCQVSAVHDNILFITTTSSAFAHKLRFMSPEILSLLREDPKWSALKAIQIKVQPLSIESSESQKLPAVVRNLSQQTSTLIQSVAGSISAAKLRQSLLRLAKRVMLQ